jgi:pimeloyl-ACP methyl ester carboxylesterase
VLIGILAVTLVVGGGMAAYSASRAARIGDLHPPVGRFANVDGGRLHYVEAGPRSAQPVLLLHGNSGNLNDLMLALGEPLSKDLRLVAVDRPGHGWSQPLSSHDAEPVEAQARYIVGLLDELNIDKAIVVGHSWSGALALTLALDYPDRVAGLALLAPASHPWSGGIPWYQTLASLPVFGQLFTDTVVLPFGELVMEPSVRAAFAPQALPDDYVERAGTELVLRPAEFRANARDLAELYDHVAAEAPRYSEIAVPTVIITGTEDRKVSPRLNSKRLADEIASSRLVELDGVGHMPHFAAPETVVIEIERLASELDRPEGGDLSAASTPPQSVEAIPQ